MLMIQVREPYSVVGFLADRIDLPDILNLKLDEDEGDQIFELFRF